MLALVVDIDRYSVFEHDRLDGQSAALVALMNNRPFHAPISHPRKILDIGCGTGFMTNMLAARFPEAQVIGVDIAPVPEGRHEKFDNVNYVQGDIRDLIGQGTTFEAGSFDYVFQRLLVFGLSRWPEYIALITTLLKPSGWLEVQEATMQLYSGADEPISNTWWHYLQIRADALALGLDIEIGSKLYDISRSTTNLSRVQQACYKFAPKERIDAPHLAGLEKQVLGLFVMVARKICRHSRSEAEVAKLVEEMNVIWTNGFDPGCHLKIYVVTGERQTTKL